MSELAKTGVCATGTIRPNCIKRCPLRCEKELKKDGRGVFDYYSDNSVLICRWNDNSASTTVTTFDSITPVKLVKRYSRAQQCTVQIPQPCW